MAQFIQTPFKLLLNHKIHPNSKHLLGMIVSLNQAEFGCIAGNRYFAEILGVSIPTINRYLVELKEHKYIDIDFVDRPSKTKGQIRIIVATSDAMTTSIKVAKQNVVTAQNNYIKNKNLLPRDIESDWLDDYIKSTRE